MIIEITLPKEYNSTTFPSGEGITITGQVVKFEGYSQDVVENIVRRYWRKQMPDSSSIARKTLSKSKALTADEIGLLKNVPEGYDPKKHTIYKMVAANSILDRDSDQFTPAYLQAMADQINKWGASFLFNHNSDHIIGKVFSAEVQPSVSNPGQSNLIEYAMIMPNASLPGQPGNTIMDNIEAGTLTDVSVRFGGYSSSIKQVGDSYVRIIDVPTDKNNVVAFIKHRLPCDADFPAAIGTITLRALVQYSAVVDTRESCMRKQNVSPT